MAIETYRDLEAWQRAMELTEEIYRMTDTLPDVERFGLTSQLRRAAVSVPSNIAEGHGRLHRGDFVRHLSMARGSLCEAETQMLLAVRLGYVERDNLKKTWSLAQDTGRLLNGLIRSLKQD